MQPRAVQGMLDFDFMCKRTKPSVAAMIYPFGGHHVQKFYWGTKETLIPVYTTIEEAAKSFPNVSVVCNFASCRSVFEVGEKRDRRFGMITLFYLTQQKYHLLPLFLEYYAVDEV